MLRTLVVIALVLATARPTGAQSTVSSKQPGCPVARMTLLGAAVGFSAGVYIGFPYVGLNAFEDTGYEWAPWATLVGLTVVGAAIGNALAQRNCATPSPSTIPSPNIVLSETELQQLSQTIRLAFAPETGTDRDPQWTLPSVSTVTISAFSKERLSGLDVPASLFSSSGCHP